MLDSSVDSEHLNFMFGGRGKSHFSVYKLLFVPSYQTSIYLLHPDIKTFITRQYLESLLPGRNLIDKRNCTELDDHFQAQRNAARQDKQRVAAFNLGVAEAIKEVKKARNTDFEVSLDLFICFQLIHLPGRGRHWHCTSIMFSVIFCCSYSFS